MFEAKDENSPYSLEPGESIVVTIGNLDALAPGVSFSCNELVCGVSLCVRGKALAGKKDGTRYTRSTFAEEVNCSTKPCGDLAMLYCTYSQGGFGAGPQGNNPATLLLDAAFPYPVGLCGLSFPDQPSIEAYLPHGGTPGPIGNPSGGGALAGQVLTAKLNMIVFDNHLTVDGCCTQDGLPGVAFRDLVLCLPAAPLSGLNGMTVGAAVLAAESALCTGTLPAGVASFGDLAAIVEQLNLNFHGESGTCVDNGGLCAP
jgi:hypothetical protein